MVVRFRPRNSAPMSSERARLTATRARLAHFIKRAPLLALALARDGKRAPTQVNGAQYLYPTSPARQ